MSDKDEQTDETPVEEIIEVTQDVSLRVQNLMRRIDRLPPGTYELVLEKNEMRAMDWQVSIMRLERIEILRLSKYKLD
jgi:hypothetical protein